MKRTSALLLACGLTLGLLGGCEESNVQTSTCTAPSAPAGYSSYLTFIADGSYDPADPNYTAPTVEETMRDEFKLSDADAAKFEAEGKAFFVSRFGVDVDDPANKGRIAYLRSSVDPRANYHVLSFSGHHVPPEGLVMKDAAFGVLVLDPMGYDLGGEFAGTHVPAGTNLAYGRYLVRINAEEAVQIGFKALAPAVPDTRGNSAFRCELESETLGKGDASLVVNIGQDPDGRLHWYIRNVLLFD